MLTNNTRKLSIRRYKKVTVSFQVPESFYNNEIIKEANDRVKTNKDILCEMINFYLRENKKPSLEEYAKMSILPTKN